MTATLRTRRRSSVVGVATLLLLWAFWPRPVSPPYDLLVQFGLSPRHYRHTLEGSMFPLRYSDYSISYTTEYERFFQTVMSPGDRMPIWFERRGGGLFAICRTAEGGFCGFNLRRVGATWIMRSPMRLPAE